MSIFIQQACMLVTTSLCQLSSPCCILLGCFLINQGIALQPGQARIVKAVQVMLFGVLVAIITFLTNLAQNQIAAMLDRPIISLALESGGSGLIAIGGHTLSGWVARTSGQHILRVGMVFLIIGILLGIYQLGSGTLI